MRAPLASLCFLAVALAATSAHGQTPPLPPDGVPLPDRMPPLRINYSLELELNFARGTNCPKTAYMHQEVTRLLAYDPFVADPEREPIGRVRATLAVSPRGDFATVLEFFDLDGTLSLSTPYHDEGASWLACQGLMKTVAANIAEELTYRAHMVAKRKLAASAPKPEPPPASAAPPAPAASPAPAPEPVALPAAPVPAPALPPAPPPGSSLHPRFELGVAGFVAFGTGPYATGGGALHAGLSIAPFGTDRARLLFAAEGRMDGAATDANGIQTQLFAGSLLVCGSKDFHDVSPVTFGFLGCVLGTVGDVRASNHGPAVRGFLSYDLPYGAAGARIELDLRLGSTTALRPQFEILPTLHTATGGLTGWSRPSYVEAVGSVTGRAGVEAVFLF